MTQADVADDDWTACQAVGHAAWFLGLDGVLAPSASGRGHVLAAFETRAALSLTVAASTALTPDRLEALRDAADTDG